jgi:hypothetical protein
LRRARLTTDADTEFAAFEEALVDVALEGRPEDVAVAGRRWRDALDDQRDRDGSNPKKDKKDADHERRRANFSRTLNGIGILDGTFDTEGAEVIETALRRCYERNHQVDDPRTPGRQRADAIVDIFRHYLDHQDRGVNRPHLMVVIDGATLAGEAVGRCETISGYQLHAESARRLACERSSSGSCSTARECRSTWVAARGPSRPISTGRSWCATAGAACPAAMPAPKTAKRTTPRPSGKTAASLTSPWDSRSAAVRGTTASSTKVAGRSRVTRTER